MTREAHLPGLAAEPPTGQTIFHPDDGADIGSVRVQCAACGGPAYLEPESAGETTLEGVAASVYGFRCPDPGCGARSSFRVRREDGKQRPAAPAPRTGLTGGAPQTIFHPDDGVDLGQVTITCGSCGEADLEPVSKAVEELMSGAWTAYVYRCPTPGCSVALRLQVPHQADAGTGGTRG